MKLYHKFITFLLKFIAAFFLSINLCLLIFPKTSYSRLVDFSHLLPVVHPVFYLILIISLVYFILYQSLNNLGVFIGTIILWLTLFLWSWPNYGRYFALFITSAMVSILILPVINNWRPSEKKFQMANNLLFLIITIIYLWVSLMRHYNFGSHSFDLGIYTQAVYKYAYFQGFFNTIRGINQFGDHFSPILFFIAPLFWVFKSAGALIVAQTLMLTVAGWLLGKTIYKQTKDFWLAIALPIGFYLFSGIQSAVTFDFHLVAFFPLLFVLIFWSLLNHQSYWYGIFIALTLLVKENATIYIFFLGLFLLFIKGYRTKGLLTMAISLISYFLIIKLAMPFFAQGVNQSYEYFNFASLGNTPSEALKTIILHPVYTSGISLNNVLKQQSELTLLFSVGILPVILAPWLILLIAPMLFELFLFDRQSLWGMGYHYGVAIAMPLFIIVYLARKNIEAFSLKLKSYLPIIIILFAVFLSINGRTAFLSLFKKDSAERFYNQDYNVNYKLMRKIPNDVSVAASHHLVPHLATRNDIIGWPPVRQEAYVVNLKQDYLIISNLGSGASWPADCSRNIEIVNSAIDNGYEIINKEKDIYLLKKSKNKSEKLLVNNECQ